MKKATAEWIRYASDDLLGAELLATHLDAPGGIIGFLCQQCVEKILKGYCEENGIKFPKTHDVDKLLDLCVESDAEFSQFENGIDDFAQFAVDVRYPSGDVGEIDTEKFIRNAKEIFQFVSKKLSR